MSDSESTVSCFCCAAIGLVVGILIGSSIHGSIIHAQAVNHGAAEWKVDAYGKATFAWKEKAEQ